MKQVPFLLFGYAIFCGVTGATWQIFLKNAKIHFYTGLLIFSGIQFAVILFGYVYKHPRTWSFFKEQICVDGARCDLALWAGGLGACGLLIFARIAEQATNDWRAILFATIGIISTASFAIHYAQLHGGTVHPGIYAGFALIALACLCFLVFTGSN